MKKFLLVTAILCGLAASADAGWWSKTKSNPGSFNCYGSNQYSQETYYFPQNNQMILRQDLGYGSSIYTSGPITQYGVDAPLYVPQQRPWRYGYGGWTNR